MVLLSIMYQILNILLLFCSCIRTESHVILTPSGDVSVCPGAQLSFSCCTNLTYLEWNVTVFQSGIPRSGTLFVVSTSYFAFPLVVNGHSFGVTRDSASGSLPIISTLTVVNTTVELNGTNIYCSEGGNTAMSSTLVASIHIITPDIAYSDILQVSGPEVLDFRNNSVIVAFEWIEAHKRGVSYIVCTVPPANNVTYYYAGASVQLQIFYNTVYNVSMESSCGQNSTTSYITMNFTKCPQPMTNNSIVVILEDPAVVGTNASFICPSGLVLIGSKQSTCIEGGYWQPDPRELECKANCGLPSQPTNGIIIPYTSTTEGARVIFVCRNIHHNSKFLEENYTVSTCNKQGKWDPNPGNFCAITAESTTLGQSAIIAISVVSASSLLLTFLFFILGFICHRFYFKQKYTDETLDGVNENQTEPYPTALYEDILPMQQNLEMEQNTAYVAQLKQSHDYEFYH